MEALLIQAVKANYRPTETQAQSELGDIFQAMLRDNAERSEQLNPLPRAEDRPGLDVLWLAVSDERAGGDRPYETDTDDRADDVSGIGEPRQTPIDDTVRDRQGSPDGDAAPAANRSDASDQPPVGRDAQDITPARDGGTPEPGGTQRFEEQIAAVSDSRAGTPDPALPNAAQALVAPSGGNGGQTSQANIAVGVPAAAPPAAGQTQNPASSQPSAPSAGTPATPAAAASVGGNSFSIQVTVTPGQVVATPNASLGGGAATAAIGAVGNPDLTTPAAANSEPANRTTQSAATAPAPSNPSLLGAGRQPGASSNAPIVPTDGQALVTQSASTAAAAAAQKPGIASADSQTRSGATLNAPVADAEGTDAPIQKGIGETAPTRSAQGNLAQIAGGPSQDVTAQNGATKTTTAPDQHAQTAAQLQTDQAPKAVMPGAQAGVANALAQGPQIGDGGSRAGSTGSTDAAASRAASVATVATGGFAQTAVQAPDTLGSLTRSGGTHPTTANQVAVEIQKAVSAGKDQIRIRLHPAELGQIDVTLKVRQDGTVRAVVTTDRPETFDLMQRDARGLERALQDAGLKTDSGSLSFNLRGGDQQGPNDGEPGSGLAAQPGSEADRKAETPPPEGDQPAPVVSNRALDIHV